MRARFVALDWRIITEGESWDMCAQRMEEFYNHVLEEER